MVALKPALDPATGQAHPGSRNAVVALKPTIHEDDEPKLANEAGTPWWH